MNYLANIDTSAHDRMMHKYARYFKTYSSRAHSDDADEQPLLCIEGHAVVFDEPILNKEGEILVFERGCFDDHFEKGRRTDMWLAHDENEVVGSTNSGLELLVTDEGLAFRLPLTNKRYDSTIERMVESGTQSAISVGITRSKERTEQFGSHAVIFIEEAELRECSLVKEGACEQAFARLIDARYSPPLAESVRSIPFRLESGVHNVKTQSVKNARRIKNLKDRLAALEVRQQTSLTAVVDTTLTPSCSTTPVRRSMTVDQLNRMQTAETERLVEYARKIHCR